jgi:hypothetical protein
MQIARGLSPNAMLAWVHSEQQKERKEERKKKRKRKDRQYASRNDWFGCPGYDAYIHGISKRFFVCCYINYGARL